MDEEGNVCESFEIENTESALNALNAFRSRYLDLKPEIALRVLIPVCKQAEKRDTARVQRIYL